MGGRGSGGHNSKGKLRDVQCARLDVHELGREGRLKLGTRGCLFGTLRFEVAGGRTPSGWCWNSLAGPPAENRWTLYGKSSGAIGAKRILAADT